MGIARHPLVATLLVGIATLLLGCPVEPCLPGETRCGGVCVDTLTDVGHCGGCDQPCGLGSCAGGTCLCDTGAGATECAGAWPRCSDLASDPAHCGSCATACDASTGAACTLGTCECPATGATLTCGSAAMTRCCEGAACCGAACPTKHFNGVGQYYFDCLPLGTYTLEAARKAADAWSPIGTDYTIVNCFGCICRQVTTTIPNQSATWCYTGTHTARALVNTVDDVCVCPPQGNIMGIWN
jgi:hypothetical protein